ncbi:sporulation histidine kinase inhibitor Sda [Paenibacillus tritici]|uniref:Sporulation histidine kinase inhibitor Sda n=1 Tax=Paenibacillus tritici TaxID=1873425 RepID=A0ABX2DMA1_9BACL|nr:sporulation histidine kinase inhibitor Sda [Paenibacillus tritici]NQX44956.1 sporulation histidine kinase inhibitor Sda [Paenibacillus tritici]QUL53007.1 sporulation histidine kinase inhibitor Sda [Paenibacillus tritici]
METYFHPSPRPSSLELLSDEQLINIYELALEAKASPDFIQIIKNVLTVRNLSDRDHYDA